MSKRSLNENRIQAIWTLCCSRTCGFRLLIRFRASDLCGTGGRGPGPLPRRKIPGPEQHRLRLPVRALRRDEPHPRTRRRLAHRLFGAEDQFFNRFAVMARMSPVIPLVGARTKFQPVFVGDVANAAAKGACGEASPGIYELGGPEAADFRSLMHLMLECVRRRRAVVGLPEFVAMPMAGALDILQFVTMDLFVNNILTKDQVRQLARDNAVSDGFRTLSDFGIEPTAMEAVLESYLYCYRPAGQYAAMHESADLADSGQGDR